MLIRVFHEAFKKADLLLAKSSLQIWLLITRTRLQALRRGWGLKLKVNPELLTIPMTVCF